MGANTDPLSDAARAELKEAIRIVKEDRMYKLLSDRVAGSPTGNPPNSDVTPTNTPPTNTPPTGSTNPPPPPANDPPPPIDESPKDRHAYWGELGDF